MPATTLPCGHCNFPPFQNGQTKAWTAKTPERDYELLMSDFRTVVNIVIMYSPHQLLSNLIFSKVGHCDGKIMQVRVETVPQGPVGWCLGLLGAEQAAVMRDHLLQDMCVVKSLGRQSLRSKEQAWSLPTIEGVGSPLLHC